VTNFNGVWCCDCFDHRFRGVTCKHIFAGKALKPEPKERFSLVLPGLSVAGGDSVEPSFEPSGCNGVEERTPNFWVKGAKLRSHPGASARPNNAAVDIDLYLKNYRFC
jgi:hypothetical protein